jgi:hypothetical protein
MACRFLVVVAVRSSTTDVAEQDPRVWRMRVSVKGPETK